MDLTWVTIVCLTPRHRCARRGGLQLQHGEAGARGHHAQDLAQLASVTAVGQDQAGEAGQAGQDLQAGAGG